VKDLGKSDCLSVTVYASSTCGAHIHFSGSSAALAVESGVRMGQFFNEWPDTA